MALPVLCKKCTYIWHVCSLHSAAVFFATVYCVLHAFWLLHYATQASFKYNGAKKHKASTYERSEQTVDVECAFGFCESSVQTINYSAKEVKELAKIGTAVTHQRICIPRVWLWRE